MLPGVTNTFKNNKHNVFRKKKRAYKFQPNMLVVTNLHTLMLVTAVFKEPSCTYVAELTAEFCARPMDNSTTFGILELWPIHGNHHFSPVPG